jgi:hypothetical protein
MNEFVEQCRREWKRLGVRDDEADEMALEVAADLAEAEADGVPAEDVVGADPKALAADWAHARGVIRRRKIPWTAVAVVALALIAIAGGILVTTSESSSPSSSRFVRVDPEQTRRVVFVAPTNRAVLVAAPAPPVWIEANSSEDATRTLGWILLFACLGGIVLVSVASLWRRVRQEPRPAH